MRCPKCLEYFDIEDAIREGYDCEICEVQGCTNLAYYEGWYRKKDCAGLPTGMMQRRKVCKKHKSYLIGEQDEPEPK